MADFVGVVSVRDCSARLRCISALCGAQGVDAGAFFVLYALGAVGVRDGGDVSVALLIGFKAAAACVFPASVGWATLLPTRITASAQGTFPPRRRFAAPAQIIPNLLPAFAPAQLPNRPNLQATHLNAHNDERWSIASLHIVPHIRVSQD